MFFIFFFSKNNMVIHNINPNYCERFQEAFSSKLKGLKSIFKIFYLSNFEINKVLFK